MATELQFYVLETGPRNQDEIARTDALEAEGYQLGEPVQCPKCGGWVGGRPWLPPWRVEIETWGKSFGDLAFCHTRRFLVSKRFKELYEREGLVGLSEFEPVEVVKIKRYRRPRGETPIYFKANVAPCRAAVDLTACECEGSVEPVFCPECLQPMNNTLIKRWKGIAVRPETWMGEDIFRPHGTNQFIVSRRFKDFCGANSAKNAVFVPADEYGDDFYPWERENWRLSNFDETFRILKARSPKGRLDDMLECMTGMRDRLVKDAKFEWWVELDRRFAANKNFAASKNQVLDAMSEAYYNLKRILK